LARLGNAVVAVAPTELRR